MGAIRVLHVDDDPQVRELVAAYLEDSVDVVVHGEPTASAGLAAFRDGEGFDCVVSDYGMPGDNGVEFLASVRELDPAVPFILYTGEGSEDVAATALEHDVSGYIRKGGTDKLKLLENRIRHEVSSYTVASSYREYRTVVESMRDPVYVLDEQGRITDVNPAFTELTGYDETELVGREMSVIKTPEMVAKSERHLRSLLSDEQPDRPLFEVEIRTADGRTITCEDHLGVIPFEDDQFRGSVGVLRNVEERTRRERELARERDRFRTLFEMLPVAAVHAELQDGEPIVQRVNDEFERVFGYEGDAITQENLDRLIAPEGVGTDPEALTNRLESGGRVTEITTRRTAEGDRLFRIDVFAREPTDDEPAEAYATYLDVSDVEAIQRQERALIERMSEGLFSFDADWRITTFNEGGYELLREAAPGDPSRETLRGQVLWEAVPDAVGTEFETQYREAMTTQESVSFEAYYEPLGRWFDVRAFPAEDGLSVHFRNVTDDRERRREIGRREATLRDVYEAVADTSLSFETRVERLLAIAADVLDASYGTLARVEGNRYTFEVTYNEAGDDRTGETIPLSETACERVVSSEGTVTYADTPREAPELMDRELVAERDVSCYVGAPVFVDGEVYGVFCLYASDSRSRFTEWEVTLVNLLGRLVGYTLQNRRAQSALERQNERLEELATLLSHDLRNPLSVARGNLELAREEGDAEFFDKTTAALDRIEELTTDLLALAREGQSVEETDPVALGELAREAWGTVSTDGARLSVETDAVVAADERRLRRILENLYRNALEHAGDEPQVTVGATDDGFYVADDGPGVPPEDRETIFESGVTTAEHGHGLGLAIVQQLADAHGWDVAVEESESGGARFVFSGVRFEG